MFINFLKKHSDGTRIIFLLLSHTIAEQRNRKELNK